MVAYPIPVYPSSSRFEYTAVDPYGALAVAVEAPGWPQSIGAHTLYRGKCDHEALVAAAEEAAAKRPVFNSYLAAVGPPWRQELVWRHQSRPLKVELMDLTDVEHPPDNIAQWLNSYTGFVDSEPDPTCEFPLRFHVCKLSGDLSALGFFMHHAAGDLGPMTGFLIDMMAGYNRRVLGTESTLAQDYLSHSASRVPDPVPTPPLREYLRVMRAEDKEYPRKLTAQPFGTPGAPGRINTKLFVDADVVTELRARARAIGGSITDVTVAAASLAIAEWNTTHGEPPLMQRHNVAVSQRGRTSANPITEGGNDLSLVTICTNAGDWDDPGKLLEKGVRVRSGRMAEGYDVMLSRGAARLTKVLGVIPVNARLRAMQRAARPDQTLLVTNHGVIGQKKSAAKNTVTEDLAPAGLTQVDRVSTGLAIPQYPHNLAIENQAAGMQVTMCSNSGATTEAELKTLLKLVVERIEAYAD